MPDKPKREQKVSIDAVSISRTRTPDFQSVYVNNANFGVNFFDIRFLFGQLALDPGGVPYVEDKVAVTMSMEHAKALLVTLDRLIKDYEQENGPIRNKTD